MNETKERVETNHILLCGTVKTAPETANEAYGPDYVEFILCVPRTSGTEDLLRVAAPREMAQACQVGSYVSVEGSMFSYNTPPNVFPRLVIAVVADSIKQADPDEKPDNTLTMSGTVCKTPFLRTTPMGRVICDLMLSTSGKPRSYIPCLAWGRLAYECAELAVKDGIEITGRFQSRTYIKTIDGEPITRTALEVSISEARFEKDEPAEEA